MTPLLKKPSAWVPIALSLLMLAILSVSLFRFGVMQKPDEGMAAHLFQIWLVLETLMIGFFGITRLKHASKEALPILMLQVIAALTVIVPVFFLKL